MLMVGNFRIVLGEYPCDDELGEATKSNRQNLN